jgi:hypothetical protein
VARRWGTTEGPLRGSELDVARADVVHDGVAKDVLLPVGGGNLVAGFADDNGELGFIVRLRADLWKNDRGVRSDDGARKLHEDGRDFLHSHLRFGCVAGVVEADGEDAWRAYGRVEGDLRQSDARSLVQLGGDVSQREFSAFDDAKDAGIREACEVNNFIADEDARGGDIAAKDDGLVLGCGLLTGEGDELHAFGLQTSPTG